MQLHYNRNRASRVLHRKPGAKDWDEVTLDWAMKAKLEGAKIIHLDPRFTRTSAKADIYVPIRAGSDIAFLGGIINYVLNDQRWNTDPFFQQYLVNYTNAASIINEDFHDTEDLDGIFSGFMQHSDKEDQTEAVSRI